MRFKRVNLCFLICILLQVLFTSMNALAASSDVEQIYKLLKNKTIENYKVIETPLIGTPTDFNMSPSDDIKKIDFGDGLEGYSINYKKIKEISEDNLKNNIDTLIVKDNSFYFPVKVSGKIVGIATIAKVNSTYTVISMGTADDIVTNIEKAKKTVAENHKNESYTLSYMSPNTYLNGFRVKTNSNDYFIYTFDSMISDTKKLQSDSIDNSFKKLKSKVIIDDSNVNTSGNNTRNVSDNPLSNVFYMSLGFIIIVSIIYYLSKRNLSKNT